MLILYIICPNSKVRLVAIQKIQRNLSKMERYEQMERIAQNLNDMEIK